MATSGNVYVDALVGTYSLPVMRADRNITYYFSDAYSNWTDVEETAFRAALNSWARVANITVREVGSIAYADWVEYSVPDSQISTTPGYTTFGMHESPFMGTYNTGGRQYGYFNYETYVFPHDSTLAWRPLGLQQGAFGFRVMVHEIGHALGLMHTHDTYEGSGLFPAVSSDNDLGLYNQNQDPFSVMSYNRGWAGQNPWGNHVALAGYLAGPGAFDIAAIQYSVGANMDTGRGNNTYILPERGSWMSIWDVGGIDTIRYDGAGRAVIDLRSATLGYDANGGGYLSYVENSATRSFYGGYTIAADFTGALANSNGERGVIIENAAGSSNADRLHGNTVNNVLAGNGGNDMIVADAGRDKLWGGAGNDRLFGDNGDDMLAGGGGNDQLYGGNHADRLYASYGQDVLYGGNDNDQLYGGDQTDKLFGGFGVDKLFGGNDRDVLNGGPGSDLLVGGAAGDFFVFKEGFGADTVRDFQDNTDTLLLDHTLWGGGLTVNQVIWRYATDLGDDILFDFGGGDLLLIKDFANRFGLSDDITLI